MCHPPLAFADAGDLIPEHIATCREVGRHSRGRRAAEVENRTRPGQIQTLRIVVSDRTGRVWLVSPVAVRVEVLRSVQGPPQSLYYSALGPPRRAFGGPTLGFDAHQIFNDSALVIEEVLCPFRALFEPDFADD